jgi:hypothetical protein
MRRIHYAMIVGAALWLAAALWLIFSNAVGRDVYPVSTIAKFLDKVPSVVGTPIFILLWIMFLLGWLVPLIFGVSPLFRRKSKPQGSSTLPRVASCFYVT